MPLSSEHHLKTFLGGNQADTHTSARPLALQHPMQAKHSHAINPPYLQAPITAACTRQHDYLWQKLTCRKASTPTQHKQVNKNVRTITIMHCTTRQCARFNIIQARQEFIASMAASRTTASRAYKEPTCETPKLTKPVVNATNTHVKTAHVHVKLDNI